MSADGAKEFGRERRRLNKRLTELDKLFTALYEDNVTGKLTDERFIKPSRNYELEQGNLKSTVETMRRDVKQQEQKKGNIKSFIAATKKYTEGGRFLISKSCYRRRLRGFWINIANSRWHRIVHTIYIQRKRAAAFCQRSLNKHALQL